MRSVAGSRLRDAAALRHKYRLGAQAERDQDTTASLVQKPSVTSAPASRTRTMERGSLPPAIDSGGKVGALRRGDVAPLPLRLHGKMISSQITATTPERSIPTESISGLSQVRRSNGGRV
jgi:hypothetical protein